VTDPHDSPHNGQPAAHGAEQRRIAQARDRSAHWRRWGPYLSERQWGTVREDYSADGSAWEYLPHDHARSRAYRWGEDGIAGISDNHQRLCFSLALWNGNDPILKERIFGLTGNEGNHGEDPKEYYFFLDNVPSHAYMKALYKYPQRAYPYTHLVEENRRRTRHDPEFELLDTGVFENDEYFDVFVEYAKAEVDDVLIRISIVNRGPSAARLAVLPTLWFRNDWSWKFDSVKPSLSNSSHDDTSSILAKHPTLGDRRLYCAGSCELLFTENETNNERLFGAPSASPYVKDGINDYVVNGRHQAVNPDGVGTKASARYDLTLAPGETKVLSLRLSEHLHLRRPFEPAFSETFAQRIRESDEFYAHLNPYPLSEDARAIQRQAIAGLLWSKQFYNYVIHDWLQGDPTMPSPPPQRRYGRNHEWIHLYNDDILAMPDTWEYPWYAAWDLAFHVVPLALVDSDFAKNQLLLFTREWYMHSNGQLPAYEWALSDVNPPVHAWAALRVYRIEQKMTGRADHLFLERVFQKLLLNFTWWVNRKDQGGNNIYQGGFLGLDNIGVFDRSAELPTGGYIDQSDGTSWMGVYALNMLAIALELAQQNPAYEDIASKFYEHFLYIADAINIPDTREHGLWDDADGFYYDCLSFPDGRQIPMKVRSLVGLVPLLAIEILEPDVMAKLPAFAKRMQWFIDNRPDLHANVASMEAKGVGERRLLSIVSRERLRRLLDRMLDEAEFYSPHGIRALSRYHAEHPYMLDLNGAHYEIGYEPAESSTGVFGGNSNWRGPVWMPMNFLLIEALQRFHYYLGDEFKVECPKGSGQYKTLWQVSAEISHRLIDIFERDETGRRPVYGGTEKFQTDPHWRDYILFFEYFHGDNGAGLGANHQTGWTACIAKLLQQCAEYCGQEKHPFEEQRLATSSP
jgi:hypothetical protein